MRIVKIANAAKYRIDEQFRNLLIFGILIVFKLKNSENFECRIFRRISKKNKKTTKNELFEIVVFEILEI